MFSDVALNAHKYLPGAMTECSARAGWRSLLLRCYQEPSQTEDFTTRPTTDHLIVLVLDGACNIEGRYNGRWFESSYRAGSIGMTAPGEEVTLRWRENGKHSTLQLHIPEAVICSVHDDLVERGMRPSPMPNRLSYNDQLITQSLLSLSAAMSDGAPDIYAETVAHFLVSHLFIRHAKASPEVTKNIDDARIRRLDEFLRENLSNAISLDDAATVAGISRFHLVRLFRKIHGETPYRRLTRMRIEEAKRQLSQGRESVTEIAFTCGYENPAHFASAFRRWVGASPSEYRGQFFQARASDPRD